MRAVATYSGLSRLRCELGQSETELNISQTWIAENEWQMDCGLQVRHITLEIVPG